MDDEVSHCRFPRHPQVMGGGSPPHSVRKTKGSSSESISGGPISLILLASFGDEESESEQGSPTSSFRRRR